MRKQCALDKALPEYKSDINTKVFNFWFFPSKCCYRLWFDCRSLPRSSFKQTNYKAKQSESQVSCAQNNAANEQQN